MPCTPINLFFNILTLERIGSGNILNIWEFVN